MKKLPKKLWQCVELALKDIIKAERDPNMTINMGIWLNRQRNNDTKCEICFAGAVMAYNKLERKTNHHYNLGPEDYTKYNENRFYALNDIRSFSIDAALTEVYVDLELHNIEEIIYLNDKKGLKMPVFDYNTDRYEVNPDKFKINIRAIIEYLKNLDPTVIGDTWNNWLKKNPNY